MSSTYSNKDNRLDICNNSNNASSSSSSSSNGGLFLKSKQKRQQQQQSNNKLNNNQDDNILTPEVSPNVVVRYPPADTDLSADPHPHYFSEARSTPILYSSTASTSSSSSSESIPAITRKDADNRSLCSVHSGNQVIETSSTRNQVFYFGTPLPPQKHQPYQYHGGTPATTASSRYGTEQQVQQPKKKKGNILTRKWNENNNNNQSGAASIRSAFSTGRQTIKSWRQKRLNILLKKQHLPDSETDVFCDECEKYITTRIRYRNGAMVWLMSFILLLCTVILFWVPFYVKYFKDVAHFCPGCGKRIGVSYRL